MFSAQNSKSLSGKVIAITGGTSGIGEATTRLCAEAGARVLFCGRREELGRQIAHEIKSKDLQCDFIKADIRSPDEVERFFRFGFENYQKIDIAFLNAGRGCPSQHLHEVDLQELRETVETNLFGTFNCTRALLPLMMKQKHGLIVANSSFSTRRAIRGRAAYSASKHSLNALIDHIAAFYIDYNIAAFSVEPIAVATRMLVNRAAELGVSPNQVVNPHTGKSVTPEEFAEIMVSLFSAPYVHFNGLKLDLSSGAGSAFNLGQKL